MGAIAWTAINLLMSNFMVRYRDMDQVWFSQLRWVGDTQRCTVHTQQRC